MANSADVGGWGTVVGIGGWDLSGTGPSVPQWSIFLGQSTVAAWYQPNGWLAKRSGPNYPSGAPPGPQADSKVDVTVYVPEGTAQGTYAVQLIDLNIQTGSGSFNVIYTGQSYCTAPGSCNCSAPNCVCLKQQQG